MAATNFKTENNTFRKLIGNGLTYRIPRFQRDYSWTNEEWEDLWTDLLGTLKVDGESAHYMGYLVLQSTDDKTFAAVVMVKRRDREFRDASYASKLTSDYDSCANSCLRDDRCLVVNFNQSSGSCQFFAAPSEYVPVSGIMLGYKYQPAN